MGIEGFAFTSGNLSDELIEIDNKSAFEKLSNFAKVFLLNDVKIENRCDDSVILSLKDKHILIRRGRGYIPSPILLSQNLKPILATGAGLKNVFCLTKKNLAFMSQQIESLENSENYSFFKENIQRFKLLLKIEPEIIAYDLNPQYPSTKYALEESQRLGIEIIGIQHHHAHIAGTIAEHGLNEPVIGVVMDGTGFGHDGAFWGGEILIVRPDTFERFGHLKYHPMPGDTKASYEPYRMALSYVYEALGKQLFYKDLNFKDRFGDGLEFLVAMIEKDINSPLTSSCKEFFNAVSSLIGVCDYEEYKNQAFCELERLAETQSSEKYHYELTKEGNKYIVNTSIIIEEILKDIEKNVPSFVISTRFHNTVVSFILELVYLASKRYQIKKVAISGEVFQNRIIFEKVYNGLLEQDLLVYYNQSVPLNDGGIALGQAYIAHFKTKG
jgi:hydrogenase maturation protein HypF